MIERNLDAGPVATWPKNQLLLTPEEAAQTLRLGRTTIYALMKSGRLRPVHIGRSCRLSVAELERYVADLDGDGAYPQGGRTVGRQFSPADAGIGTDSPPTSKHTLSRRPAGGHQPGLFDLGPNPPEGA